MTAPHEPLVVDEVELAPPRRDEVLVRVLASGICRSDLSYMDGKWPIPCPVVLGHEGAGTIEAVGEGVDPGRVGERVVLTFAPSCGRCRFCLEGRVNLCCRGGRLHGRRRAARRHARGSRWRGADGLPPGVRLQLRHARGLPGQRRHPDHGRRCPSSWPACWAAASRRACCRSRGAPTCARAMPSRSSPAAASGSRPCRARGSSRPIP